jgi:hypothetical protein
MRNNSPSIISIFCPCFTGARKTKRHIFLIITINIELILKCKRVLYKDVGASEGFFFKEVRSLNNLNQKNLILKKLYDPLNTMIKIKE